MAMAAATDTIDASRRPGSDRPCHLKRRRNTAARRPEVWGTRELYQARMMHASMHDDPCNRSIAAAFYASPRTGGYGLLVRRSSDRSTAELRDNAAHGAIVEP